GRYPHHPSTPHTHPGRVCTSGGGHSPSPFGRGGGGGSGGTPAGRKPAYSKDNPSAVLYGLANQYLFSELEKDGVWKVSVPDGQRFGKHFLAGLETWARQVLGGEQPMLFKAVAVPVAGATATTTSTVTTATRATVTAADRASAFTNRSTPRNFIPPPPAAARTSGGGGGGGGSAAGGSTNTTTSASATAKRPHPIVSLTGCGLPGLDTIEGAAPAAAGTTAATSGVTRAGGGGATLPLAGGGGGPPDVVSLLQTQLGITATTTAGGMIQDVSQDQSRSLPAVTPAPLLEDKYTCASGQTRLRREQQVGQCGEEHHHQQLQGQYRGGGLMAHPVSEYRGLLASSSSMESHLDLDLDLDLEEGEEREVQGEVQQEGVEEESDYGDSFGDEDYEEDEELEVQEDEEDGEDSKREYYDDDEEEDFDLEDESGSSTTGLDMYDSDLDEIVVAPSTSAARIPPPAPPRMQLSSPSTAAAATAGPAPPPLWPCAPPRAPFDAVVSSPPLTLELMRQCRSLDSLGRLRISLRLERQLLNDTEVEMLAAWYEERAASLIEFSKLWFFDNRIGDRGAAAVARSLLHPGLLELHLSHNVIGDKGAAALLEALPVERPTGLRPLWLRVEWNIINADLLQQRLDEQRKARGLISDVPQVRPSSGAPSGSSPAHENRLVLGRLGNCGGTPGCGVAVAAAPLSVRLPWATSQKQPPSEAGVLRAVKGFYTRDTKPQSAAEPPAATTTQPPPASPPPPRPPSQRIAPLSEPQILPLPPPPPPPATTPSAASSSTATTATAPPPAAPQARSTTAAAYATYAAAAAAAAGGDATYAPGPLLLFPDTSALISMLGGNTTLLDAAAAAASTGSGSSPPSAVGAAGLHKVFPARSGGAGNGGNGGLRPPLDWSLLVSLAAQGRFGRSLPLPDQVFIVVTDSVMKQLDGLKSLPETRAAVRRFMSEGLELAGPAGYDFLTVLGAHEGEGLALAGEHGGLMGLAGSRSPWLATRGQAVDVRIVEVALYYQAEVTRAYQQSGTEGADGGAGDKSSPRPSFLPVILLSNDNAQISAAKSHGLPAFRLTAATELSVKLDDIARGGGGALSSGVLRQLLAPQATKALGTTATRSLQDQFDCAVGTLRGVVAALKGLVTPLERISQLAAAAGAEPEGEVAGRSDCAGELERAEDARATLREIRRVLQGSDTEPSPGDSVRGNGSSGLVSGLEMLVSGLQTELLHWESIIRSHQGPSRLVQWAALGSSAAAAEKGVLAKGEGGGGVGDVAA
ncbi:hypothetical protein VaNZ11_006518, partial [Volvox africanus]